MFSTIIVPPKKEYKIGTKMHLHLVVSQPFSNENSIVLRGMPKSACKNPISKFITLL